uniref:DAZ-associated protein 1 n=1 Tax=Schistocephalus solidus TaxID=70667 RepID=A0A0X3PGX7_SCHSO
MTDSEGNEIGKLFIGGLSQATNSESLRVYFMQFGELEDAVVMMDNKTGRSRGFGYVKYKDPESVKIALEAKPHILDGKEVDAKQCNVNMKGRNRRSLKVFVGGIGLDQDVQSLTAFFEKFGHVTDVNLMMDANKQRHRGFAFIGFDDENVVNRLINMHYTTMNNKQVEIKAMEPPNFGRKNGNSLANQNDNGDHYGRCGGTNTQNSNFVHMGMHASHMSSYQPGHLHCAVGKDLGNHLTHGIVPGPTFSVPNPPYSNSFLGATDSINQVQPYVNRNGGRVVSDQFSNASNSFSGNGSFLPGKLSVPLIFTNGFIPLTSPVYGTWNSATMPGISNTGCQALGAAYPYQVLQPQLFHPNIMSNSDEYWQHTAPAGACPQQTSVQNMVYSPYVTSTQNAGNQQSMMPSMTGSMYAPSLMSNPAPHRIYSATSTQVNASQQAQTATSASETVNPEAVSSQGTDAEVVSAPLTVSSPGGGTHSVQSPRASFQSPMGAPYRSTIMPPDGTAAGLYFPPLEQAPVVQNLWCSQLPALPVQYLPTMWNIPQTTSTDFLSHLPTQPARTDHQKPQIPNSPMRQSTEQGKSELSNVMAKPSGDDPDVYGKDRPELLETSETETPKIKEECPDALETIPTGSEKKESFEKSPGSNWQMQRPLHTWPYTVGARAPCWGDAQAGVAAHGYGLTSGIILQPHPSASNWSGLPPIYDPSLESALCGGYFRNAGYPRSFVGAQEVGLPSTSGEPFLNPSAESNETMSVIESRQKPTMGVAGGKQRDNGVIANVAATTTNMNTTMYRNRKRDSLDHHSENQQSKANKRSDSSKWIYNSSSTSTDRNRATSSSEKDTKNPPLEMNFKNSANAAGDHGTLHI